MKILVVVNNYKPDGGAGATLYPLLCEELAKKGHEVTVLAAVPHYPSGYVPGAYRGGKNRFSEENSVKVVRVGLPSVDRSKMVARLFQFIPLGSLAWRSAHAFPNDPERHEKGELEIMDFLLIIIFSIFVILIVIIGISFYFINKKTANPSPLEE